VILPTLAVLLTTVAQTPSPAPASPVARIVVTPAEPLVIAGDSLRLAAQALDAAGRPVPGATVRFFATGLGLTVDQTSGMVRAGYRGVFPVRVVALVPGARAFGPETVTLTVVPPPADRIEIAPSLARLVVGQQVRLTARVFAANGDSRDDAVTWASSAPAVVAVDGDGWLTARAGGRATVTARAGGATASLAVEVLGAPVRRLEITGGASEARTGDVLRFGVAARDAAGREITGLTPSWSMAPGAGLLDPDGAFVAYEPGEFTVTASLGAAQARTQVRVRPRDVRRPTTVVGRLPVAGRLTAEFWPHPDGRHAYLSTVSDRVYALDITDPAAVRVTDSMVVDARHINDVMTTADGRWGVFTRENASSRRNGIVVFSAEDPAHPRVVAEYTETVTGGVHSAFVYTQPGHGTHVYLTDDATGSMRVIELNDPLHPREVARWQMPIEAGRYLHDIEVRDGLAYLSYWDNGLVVLDVGDGRRGGTPRQPQLVAQYKYDLESLYRDVGAEGGPGFIRGTHTAWRHGRYAFVGDEVFTARPQGIVLPGLGLGKANGRLHVVDVSDLANPREVAWYEPKDGGAHNVWVAGDTLYLGDYQGGLRVLDISGELKGDLLAQGREIAHVHTGDARGHVPNAAMTWGAFHVNGLVWANDMFSGLWVVRIEPRETPRAAPPIP
jgi:hypothetical protein